MESISKIKKLIFSFFNGKYRDYKNNTAASAGGKKTDMMKRWILISILLCTVWAEAAELRIVTEEFPPYNYFENGKLTGISTEVVQAVLKEVGAETEIEVYPWARAYKVASEHKNVLIYSIGRIKEREELFNWVGVIAPCNLCLFKLKERKDINIQVLEDARKYEIGVLREDMCLQYLLNKGFVIKTVTNADENSIRMLMKNRVDLIPFDELGFAYKIKILGFNPSDFEKIFFLEELSGGLYMAFSKQTSENLTEKFRNALDRIKADGTYNLIINKYLNIR